MAPEALDLAIAAIADGEIVDWSSIRRSARSDEDRRLVECLRIVAGVSDLHRSAGHQSMAGSAATTVDLGANGSSARQRWGRYVLLEEVGAGSFGTVFRAWDPQLEREVAIKLLRPLDPLYGGDPSERLLREGRTLARIRHPNVVTVIGVEEHDGRVGLSMEFIRGETLEDFVDVHGTFSAREAAVVGQDVCRALAAVHDAGLVHRDVKGRNVMREQAGRIVLMDFGTGREAAPLAAGSFGGAGTPIYMAPEVLAGEPATVQSDIYSVGVLLFYLVSRRYPFDGRTFEQLRRAHADGHRTFLTELRPDLPTSFVRVVERALASSPEARYRNAGALLRALGEALGVEAPPSPAVVESPWKRVATIVAALVLVTVFLTALGFLSTMSLNIALGRTAPFGSEPVWSWTLWGLRSIVAPTVMAVQAVLAVWLVAVVRSLLVRSSRRIASADASLRARLGQVRDRLGLDDANARAWVAAVAFAIAFGTARWYFAPLIDAVTGLEPTRETLARLAPTFADEHDRYRQVFSALVLAMTAAWWSIRRLTRRTGRPVNPALYAVGAALLASALFLLDLPYRLFLHSEFEAVDHRGSRCYIVGERADDVLLFCPLAASRGNLIVRKADPELHPLGVQENVFTPLGPPHPRR